MPRPRETAATEVGGVYRTGSPCPGSDGPFPGPFFNLSINGSLYRGRYVESGVWKSESGSRFSQISDSDTISTRTSPEYARLRLNLIHELMDSRRHYSPQEIAVALRNHPETDHREVEILESSSDWSSANRATKGVRW